MIRNFKNFVVKEEQEVINNWDDMYSTKGYNQIRKIVESYGFKLFEAIINERPYLSIKKEWYDSYGKNYLEIKYNDIEHGFKNNEYSFAGSPFGYEKLYLFEERADIYDNAMQLVKKLQKLDLSKILPIYNR